jgi:hypothetical protein
VGEGVSFAGVESEQSQEVLDGGVEVGLRELAFDVGR